MDSWKLWQHSLESLAERYYLVAFDLKGCGQSSMNYPQALFPEVKDPSGDYTLTLQADEIATALDKLGIKRFNLVTLDLGSIIKVFTILPCLQNALMARLAWLLNQFGH